MDVTVSLEYDDALLRVDKLICAFESRQVIECDYCCDTDNNNDDHVVSYSIV